MTNDEKDRVSLGSIRFIFSNISVLCITTFTTFFVMNFGENQQGWTYTSAIYGLLCAVPVMITGYFVKERNVANKQYKDVKEKNVSHLF